MVVLYTVLIILVFILVIFSASRARFLMDASRRGKLPAKGRATMFEVRQYLMEGKKELAIRVYCEIFQTTPIKAKKDVEDLERSLKV